MRVSFDGETYDPDRDDVALRDACLRKAERVVAMIKDEDLRSGLTIMLASTSHIAVKLGATAALHHAYSQPCDYEIVNTFAHVINKLVGLNYVLPEQVLSDPSKEIESGNE